MNKFLTQLKLYSILLKRSHLKFLFLRKYQDVQKIII